MLDHLSLFKAVYGFSGIPVPHSGSYRLQLTFCFQYFSVYGKGVYYFQIWQLYLVYNVLWLLFSRHHGYTLLYFELDVYSPRGLSAAMMLSAVFVLLKNIAFCMCIYCSEL